MVVALRRPRETVFLSSVTCYYTSSYQKYWINREQLRMYKSTVIVPRTLADATPNSSLLWHPKKNYNTNTRRTRRDCLPQESQKRSGDIIAQRKTTSALITYSIMIAVYAQRNVLTHTFRQTKYFNI